MAERFLIDDEQIALREVVRSFVSAHADEDMVRTVSATERGYDPTTWDQLARELEIVGLCVPEHLGGSGYGMAGMRVVLEETGAVLLPSPLLASGVLAVHALVHSDDHEAQERFLPALADGSVIGTVALERPARSSGTAVAAEDGPSGTRLTGVVEHVLHGAQADLLLVAANGPEGSTLYAVDLAGSDVRRRSLRVLDPTLPLARLELRGAHATRIGGLGAAGRVLDVVLDAASGAVAAEQVGGMRTAVARSVEYVSTRHQFGRPVGSFQAVKHRCAGMQLALASARAVMENAVGELADASDRQAVTEACSLAKSYCSDAYTQVATETIQVHGGIGFTWEHWAHLYYRRAYASSALFGSPRFHRERMLVNAGLGMDKRSMT